MDVKRHAHIYDDLLKLDIQLNFQDVPSPYYIQEQIIKCNSFQLKAERYFIEVTRDLSIAERLYTTEKLNISTLRINILTNDERIKKIPTGKEREAAADEILEDNHRELLKLENDVNDLKAILSAIRQKQSTLRSTNSDIKSLQKLMEQQVNRLNIGHPDDPDVKHLSDAFKDIDKLEEEFKLDEVESSIEISQSEDPEEVLPEDSAEFGMPDDLGESVALEGSDISDGSIVLGDESEPEPKQMDNQEADSQSAEDIGEITDVSEAQSGETSSEPERKGSPSSDAQSADDIEDELASLFTEDESDAQQPEDSDRDGDEQISKDEPVVENDSVADAADSDETPDIDIDDEISSDVESRVTEPPKVEVDLSDLGIDLDLGDSDPVLEESPRTKEKEPTKETGKDKSDVKKSEDPPVQKASAESKKDESDTMDIDLNDILDQF